MSHRTMPTPPTVISPVYSATKAFMHSYAISAREALRDTAVQLYEVSPPLVKTAMSGNTGEEVDDFTASVVGRIAKGEKEVGFRMSEDVRLADRAQLQHYFGEFTKGAAAFGLFKPHVAQQAAR